MGGTGVGRECVGARGGAAYTGGGSTGGVTMAAAAAEERLRGDVRRLRERATSFRRGQRHRRSPSAWMRSRRGGRMGMCEVGTGPCGRAGGSLRLRGYKLGQGLS